MIGALALLLLAAASSVAGAASFTLTEAQRREAVLAGERSITRETFDREWRVDSGAESVTVLTPFHRVMLAARHAAFRREPLAAGEPERVLREQAGRLVLWAHLRGPREGFARFYEPRLLVGERRIKATFVQNERTAARQEDGTYLARCLYGFPVKDLPGASQVVLVVADAAGQDVSHFTIGLARMR